MVAATIQRKQEAMSFIGRNGLYYADQCANEKEKQHFEGVIYKNGTLDADFLSSLVHPAKLH